MAIEKLDINVTAVYKSELRQPVKKKSGKFKFSITGLIVPAALLVAWWAGTATGALDSTFFSSPLMVLKTLWELTTSGELISGFGDSLLRILSGAAIGFSGGIIMGGITGYARRMERVLDPTVQALRAIPSVAWIPFLILGLGIGNAPKIALIAIAIFFITYVNTYAGVRGTDQKLIELAKAYRLPKWLIIRKIVMPAALPQVFVGLRLAAAIGWIASVFSEILIGNSGLGVLLNDGRALSRPDQTIVLMLVLAIAGKCSDGLIRLIERKVTSWRATFEGV